MYRTLEIFAGIGGFSLGLERTGQFRTVAHCEIDRDAQAVLRKHWPRVPVYGDVRALTARRLADDGINPNCIVGGFPCQDVSLAGSGAGLDGARSGLWSEYADSLASFDPTSSSWRTSQLCLDGASEPFSETWPRSGLMLSGIAYPLPTLVPDNFGTEFGLWPTPNATAFKGGRSHPGVVSAIPRGTTGKTGAALYLANGIRCPRPRNRSWDSPRDTPQPTSRKCRPPPAPRNDRPRHPRSRSTAKCSLT
jgi:hypothetical protein